MPQCAALKADGTKCQRSANPRGKYCASHKGWRPTGTARKKRDALAKARAMKAVRARAKKATGGKGAIRNRPAALKVLGAKARCGARTTNGGACKRLPAPGSKRCRTHKGLRA